MNKNEVKSTDTTTVLDTYNSLDAGSQCIATAILQLAVTLFTGIQNVQSINKQQEEN